MTGEYRNPNAGTMGAFDIYGMARWGGFEPPTP